MNSRVRLTAALSTGAFALALSACQGSFGSGGTSAPGGVNPPVNTQVGQQNAVPTPSDMKPSPGASSSAGGFTSFAFADVSKGIQCPEDQGFSCTLRFNVTGPDASPSPSASPGKAKAGGKATATPSPTPTPTPTPTPSPEPSASDASNGSPAPSPSVSPSASAAGAHIALASSALPKDAPKMENPDPKAVATVALMSIRLKTDADVILDGKAIAEFTLPKEQIGGRGFAVQLFRESVKKGKRTDSFAGTYSQSKLDKETLRFQLTLPKMQVKKDETWLLVLYGDELPSASSSPKSSASPGESAAPDASALPTFSPEASPTP